MKKRSKILLLLLFAIVISLPLFLWGMRILTGNLFDVQLLGYTDSTARPTISLQALASGEFQKQTSSWVEETVPLRGVYIRNYNTLQYYAFHRGNRLIGYNNSIYEYAYLDEYLSNGDTYDFSLQENRAKMEETVAHMVSVKQKLEALGKHLYVYLVPGKAEFYPENIPDSYLAMGNADSPSALELMTSLLKDTDIPCLFCEELTDDLEYPAFYSTGIHWSRTFEQKVSQRLLSDFSALTGKAYKSFEFTGVEESSTPFWRDTDGYDLLNIWTPSKGVYYQYQTETTIPQDAEPLQITLWGDSFGMGLRYDLADGIFLDTNLIYINRDDYVQLTPESAQIPLGDDWSNLDWQTCLDLSDIIVVEMVAHEIVNETYGFVQALDDYLDTYIPHESVLPYIDAWDASELSVDGIFRSSGLWNREDGFTWTKGQTQLILRGESIAQNGLEIFYAVPLQAIQPDCGDTVTITVNGTVISEKTYWQETEDTLTFPPETLPEAKAGSYCIGISCSETFNPKEMGASDDGRDLGIRLMYVGGVR